MTTVAWIDGEGSVTDLYAVKIRTDNLTLTPFSRNGPDKRKTSIWKKTDNELRLCPLCGEMVPGGGCGGE